MPANRRRHANSVPVATFFAIVAVGAVLGTLALGFLWCKNDMNTTGVKIKKAEQELVQLRQRNEAAQAGIDSLKSTAHLDRQFRSGLYKRMEPVERLKSGGLVTVVQVQRVPGATGELRRVVNERRPE